MVSDKLKSVCLCVCWQGDGGRGGCCLYVCLADIGQFVCV